MKRRIFFLLALVAMTGLAKNVVVERPAFRSLMKNFNYRADIWPVKVELTKHATVVHFHVARAARSSWSTDGGWLEVDGRQFAYQKGRILTHDGSKVLADDDLELGKDYERNAQRDSLILYFEPLPKGTKTFDYIGGDAPNAWTVYGIRLDKKLYPELLPAYQEREDDGKPLEPLALTHGEASVSVTVYGDSICQLGWFDAPFCDPITGFYRAKDRKEGTSKHFSNPVYTATFPIFTFYKIEKNTPNRQFPLLLIPGETLTLDADPDACEAWLQDFAAGKPKHKGYRFGGSTADLNEVLLENLNIYYPGMAPLPSHEDAKDFPEWRNKLWQNLDTLKQGVLKRRNYTRRQKDFLTLLADRLYVRYCVGGADMLAFQKRIANPDSTLAHLKSTFKLTDPHARELQFFRDGRTFWLPLMPELLPYFEANGMAETEPYKMTKAMAEAKKMHDIIAQGKVMPEDSIKKIHPHFQGIVREFNDTTRVQLERLQREAKERMMPTPEVPGDKLLEAILKEHSGKVVFFDLWATWCGPCRQGIEAMEPLKEELQGKDVVFVYLTDESSSLNEWREYVIKTPGLHYRLPSSKWKQMPISGGIPQYYLFDRQGHKIWEQTGFGDAVLEDIEKQLYKALEP